jgi:hypothetical protein
LPGAGHQSAQVCTPFHFLTGPFSLPRSDTYERT